MQTEDLLELETDDLLLMIERIVAELGKREDAEHEKAPNEGG